RRSQRPLVWTPARTVRARKSPPQCCSTIASPKFAQLDWSGNPIPLQPAARVVSSPGARQENRRAPPKRFDAIPRQLSPRQPCEVSGAIVVNLSQRFFLTV